MTIISLDTLEDPRLAVYRDLIRSQDARRQGLVIVEGRWLVERLLRSRLEVVSVVVERSRQAQLQIPGGLMAPVFEIPRKSASDLVGFEFHRGVLACARRPAVLSLEDVEAVTAPDGARLVVVCVGIQDSENLGGVLRNSAGFGAGAVALGPGCGDPWSRRALRVSMGCAFDLPIVESFQLEPDLTRLESRGFALAATVVDAAASPLSEAPRPARTALLFGGEAFGLPQEWIARCPQRLTIPMSGGTDSLNVAVASGVFLHHFSR